MFKIITAPFDRKIQGFDDEILSNFVLNKKIKSYQASFFQDSSDSYQHSAAVKRKLKQLHSTFRPKSQYVSICNPDRIYTPC